MKSPVMLFALLLVAWAPGTYNPIVPRGNNASFFVVNFGIAKRLMLTEAEVDGKKGLFLFDTGASHLTLHQKHFSAKRVVKNVGTTNHILEGETPLHAVVASEFAWGGIRLEQVLCPITDLSTMEKQLGYSILGLIGYSVLKDYAVEIDYTNQIIRLTPNIATIIEISSQPDHSLDFKLCGHVPVLTANIGAKQTAYLSLDSGASVNVIDRSWRRQLSELALRQDRLRFTGAAAGEKEADYFVLEKITLGEQFHLPFAGMLLTDFNGSSERCFRVDGLVGIDAFACRRIVIDYRNFKLHVWHKSGF